MRLTYQNGILRERWDDAARTYTAYDASGAQTSSRAYTAAENAQADAAAQTAIEDANATTIRQQALDALASNATFIALNNPNSAQIAAQVKALTRQSNKVIRLILGRLDGTE